MTHFVGLDVSVKETSVCVVDDAGKVILEQKVPTEPSDIIALLTSLGATYGRIGIEAGPLSQWLVNALTVADLSVICVETRHMKALLTAQQINKTDRNDARGIAQMMRVGLFKPVHVKTLAAQEQRMLLTSRKLLQRKLLDVECDLRGTLRNFGLKVGPTTPTRFAGRIRQLVTGHPSLEIIAEALLSVHAVLLHEFKVFEKRVRMMARDDARTRLLMTTTGVGPIVSLTYVSAIDDPARFKSSKTVGAHFGMTPKKYQSGEIDYTGRISKIGDKGVRTALFQAAHIILTKPVKGSALKTWALRLAKRVGMSKAKVALARKLAVIMHRMLVDGKPFNFAAGAAA